MSTPTLDTATKTELRILCKAAGIKGYGAMDNAKMRAALKAAARKNLDSDPGMPDAATARIDKAVAKSGSKKARKKQTGDQPSVRQWLETRLAKGELSVADAKAFVESTGRSAVTMYRQAKELGYGVRKAVFAKD